MMNRIATCQSIHLFVFAALVLLCAGCEQEGSRAAAPAPATQETAVYTLHVSGMTCEGCVSVIEDTLARTQGVVESSVDLETGMARVEVESEISPETMIEVIQGIGAGQYQAKPSES